jgi:hypothetical protein
LATTGKINIPGITPKKKPTPVAAPKPKPKIETTKEEPVVDTNTPETVQSPESIKQGAVKLAEVWNEMPSDKLTKVVSKWKPKDLAIVLNEMDPAKVAELLGSMNEKAASAVSLELQKVAAQIPAQ